MADQPPLSEIFEAMAQGIMARYIPPMIPGQNYSVSMSFDSKSYDRARDQAEMFRAVAEVYRKYEAADKPR